MEYKKIEGGITAPLGFRAAGIHCGLRKNKSKKDIAMIFSDRRCSCAGVFTQNRVYAAPVGVTKAHIADGYARAAICNSGNANTCNADGYDKANMTCEAVAAALNIPANDVIVASTGVIGVPLPIEPILDGIPQLVKELDYTPQASENAAVAIMTTDTKKKEYAYSYEFGGKTIRLGGICKGSGMIEPNMATMICFITTDASIAPDMLKTALKSAITDTFNMVSVDGDTSTNDTVTVLASGMAENEEINAPGEAYDAFAGALLELCRALCKAIASDGEGATKLLECNISGCRSLDDARHLAKSIIKSSLVKAAMFGADANWGRILCALGYAGVDLDVDKIDVSFASSAGEILVCQNGRGYPFDEDEAKKILLRKHIKINVALNDGEASATAWGCDLSYEYVRINGDYRS